MTWPSCHLPGSGSSALRVRSSSVHPSAYFGPTYVPHLASPIYMNAVRVLSCPLVLPARNLRRGFDVPIGLDSLLLPRASHAPSVSGLHSDHGPPRCCRVGRRLDPSGPPDGSGDGVPG